MARVNSSKNDLEYVAGNGLLHRRALLQFGAASAGALGVGAGLTTPAAAAPLAEALWGLAPGDAVPAYQTPSQHAKNVARTCSLSRALTSRWV